MYRAVRPGEWNIRQNSGVSEHKDWRLSDRFGGASVTFQVSTCKHGAPRVWETRALSAKPVPSSWLCDPQLIDFHPPYPSLLVMLKRRAWFCNAVGLEKGVVLQCCWLRQFHLGAQNERESNFWSSLTPGDGLKPWSYLQDLVRCFALKNTT